MNEEREQKTDGKEEGDDDEDEPNLLCVCFRRLHSGERERNRIYIYERGKSRVKGPRRKLQNYPMKFSIFIEE